MTPTQINKAVARKLGWIYSKKDRHWHEPTCDGQGPCVKFPDFANTWAGAWELVGKLAKRDIYLYRLRPEGDGFSCGMVGAKAHMTPIHAKTKALAICEAFLKLEDFK